MIDYKLFKGDFVSGIFKEDHISAKKNQRFIAWLKRRRIKLTCFEGRRQFENWGEGFNARIQILGEHPIPGKIFVDMGIEEETFEKARNELKKMVRRLKRNEN